MLLKLSMEASLLGNKQPHGGEGTSEKSGLQGLEKACLEQKKKEGKEK